MVCYFPCNDYGPCIADDLSTRLEGTDRHRDASNIPVLHVLWTQFKDGQFELSVVKQKNAKSRWELVQYVGKPEVDSNAKVEKWCETVMNDAYAGTKDLLLGILSLNLFVLSLGIKRRRRFRVLVNPHGGQVSCKISLVF